MGSDSKVVPAPTSGEPVEVQTSGAPAVHSPARRSRWFLPPNSRIRATWDLILLALVLYVCFELPVSLGFPEADTEVFVNALNLLVDILFAVDILVNFRTSLINRWGEVTTDYKEVGMVYVKGWFMVDIIATVPFEFVCGFFSDQCVAFRLPKLLRLGRLARKFRKIVSNNYLRLGMLILLFVLAGHWAACVGYYVAREEALSGSASWVTKEFPLEDLDSLPLRTKYTTAMYWAMTTLTSVGYGDIVPLNSRERAYTIVILTLGAVIYATVFANVTSVIAELDASGSRYKERVSAIREFFRLHDLPDKLMERTVSYVDAAWSVEKGIDITPVLDELPHTVREDIMMRLHGQEVQNMSFFKSTSKAFLRAIVTKLRPQVCLAGDHIVRSGDLATEMYFLHKGCVEVTNDGRTVELKEGAFFGEAALLHTSSPAGAESDDEEEIIARALSRRRNANVKAVTFCYMFALRAEDFEEVITAFPDLRSRTKELLMSRGRGEPVAKSAKKDAEEGMDSDEAKSGPLVKRGLRDIIVKHRRQLVVPKELTLAASIIQLGWRQYQARLKLHEVGTGVSKPVQLTQMLQLSVFHKRLRRVTQAKTGWTGSISALKKATEHQVDLLRSQVSVMQDDYTSSIKAQDLSIQKVSENLAELRQALMNILQLHSGIATAAKDVPPGEVRDAT